MAQGDATNLGSGPKKRKKKKIKKGDAATGEKKKKKKGKVTCQTAEGKLGQ